MMLAALRAPSSRSSLARAVLGARTLATETTLPDNPSTLFLEEAKRLKVSISKPEPETEEQQQERFENFLKEKENEKPARPHRNIAVDPNHGLWAFFRKVERDGKEVYETLERDIPGKTVGSGRAWNAFELRRKSFKDLHTLWYIVLRERNLVASQRAEAKRLEIAAVLLSAAKRDYMCRKTMARIKQVLNERRIAFEQAVAIRKEELHGGSEEGVEETKAVEVLSRRRIGRQTSKDIHTYRANTPTEPQRTKDSEEVAVDDDSVVLPQTTAATA